MKKYFNIILLLPIFMIVGQLTAQEVESGGFKIKSVDFSTGTDSDMVMDLNSSYFIDQLSSSQQASLRNLDFNSFSAFSGTCENPSISVGVTLVHPKASLFEWRNLVSYKPNRIDAINLRTDNDFLDISSTHTEIAAESAILLVIPNVPIVNIYIGAGTNLGVTTSNTTCVFTTADLDSDNSAFGTNETSNQVPAGSFGSGDGYHHECFDTGSQINQRLFLQVGFGAEIWKRVEIGLDLKYGIGYRADIGNSIRGTNLNSTNFILRYKLK